MRNFLKWNRLAQHEPIITFGSFGTVGVRFWSRNMRFRGGPAIPLVFGLAGAVAGSYVGGIYGFYAIGISAGFMLGSFLGNMLFPTKSESEMPKMARYPVQRTSKAVPVPILYGTCKIAGNVIWMGTSHPYTITHSAGGGKGFGGGGGGETTETRYRRSFLISLCEGPAGVLRIWAGKDEIALEDVTIFTGMNNVGIPLLTGETYGQYSNLCCVFFDEFELGNSEQLPNFTFEVTSEASGSSGFITSCDISPPGYYSVAKLHPDGSPHAICYSGSTGGGVHAVCVSKVDGSIYFAQYGTFIDESHFFSSFDTGTGTIAIGDTIVGQIGGINLVVEDIFYTNVLVPGAFKGQVVFRAATAGIIPTWLLNEVFDNGAGADVRFTQIPTSSAVKNIHKFSADGKLVKTWGEGGRKCIYGASAVYALAEDDQGNLYYGSYGGHHGKLDATGKYVWSVWQVAVTKLYLQVVHSIVLSEDQNWVYMAGPFAALGSDWGVPLGVNVYTVMKLSTGSGAYATNWGITDTGTYDGRFRPTLSGWGFQAIYRDPYTIRRASGSEVLYLHHYSSVIGAHRYSLTKVAVNGSYDTTWCDDGCTNDLETPVYASSGYDRSMVVDEFGNVWTAGFSITLANVQNLKVCYVKCHNSSGALLYSWTKLDLATTKLAHSIGVWGGCIYLGGSSRIEDAINSPLHRYAYDGVHDVNYLPAAFEVGGVLHSTISAVLRYDVNQWVSGSTNPVWAIYDLFTNSRCGAAIKTSLVDVSTFEISATHCVVNGLLFSFFIDQSRPVLDWVDYICSHFFGFIYTSGGLVKIGIYRDELFIKHIDQDHIKVAQGSEKSAPLVKVTKRPYSETFNRIEVSWTNRSKDYDASVAVAQEEVDQRISGIVRKKTYDLLGITSKQLAVDTAYRLLYEAMYRYSRYSFDLGYQDMLLKPGQVITLSDGYQIVKERARITGIAESKDGKDLSVSAVEDAPYLYRATSYGTEDTAHVPDTAPTLVSPLAVYREDPNDRFLYISLVPQGVQSSGWLVYRSYDDITYSLISTVGLDSIATANAHGLLDTALVAHTAVVYRGEEFFDVTLDADLALDSTSDAAFFNNRHLAKIGNEIIGYRDVILLAGTTYRVSGLIRGLFNTEPDSHAVGAVFYTLNIDFTYAFQEVDVGSTLYFKFLTFYGDEAQQVDEVTPSTYQIVGEYKRPPPVSLMRINGREGHITVSAYPINVNLYFGSKAVGFNLGGFGDVPWGSFADFTPTTVLYVRLQKTDATLILVKEFSLAGLALSFYQFQILDADRGGNDPIDVVAAPISSVMGRERIHRVDIV